MPAFLSFETDTIEKLEQFQFDDPYDDRRYFARGDDQINGVGDTFARDLPPFVERVRAVWEDFPVFGSVCEAHEMIWRIIGSENAMLWMGMFPDVIAHFVSRLHEFSLGILRGQIQAAGGCLDGIVIWGDVAYKKGMLFSPAFWRQHFKPGVKALVDECHMHGLPVIYHGCGNVNRIFQDFIEIGVDAYNPLEAKAGLDVVDLRRRFGHRIGFCGNMDVQLWASGTKEELRAAVLTKLNAAKGGGFIFQSDHSVPGNVSAENYDYVVRLVRRHGVYPLRLEEFDLPDIR
jgi:uroporphyrinogen-III decarboxylase